MPIIDISEITLGDSNLAVVNNGNRANRASTLSVSYIASDQIRDIPTQYKKETITGFT